MAVRAILTFLAEVCTMWFVTWLQSVQLPALPLQLESWIEITFNLGCGSVYGDISLLIYWVFY